MANQEPERLLVNFLRENLTDLNSSRSGQWIYEDKPIVSLTNASYPRVSVNKIVENGSALGIFDDQSISSIVFQVEVYVKKDIVYTLSISNESVGTISQNISLDYIPTAITNIQTSGGHTFATVTFVDNDNDFTSPSVDAVEVSRSTGNLRFNTSDLTTYSGQGILATYDVSLANDKACKWIARDIEKTMRTEWRTNREVLGGLFFRGIDNNNQQPFDEVR